jgi:hypothetical protein
MDHKDFHGLSSWKDQAFPDLFDQQQVCGEKKMVRHEHQENGNAQETLPIYEWI